jgi:hypothetical protein
MPRTPRPRMWDEDVGDAILRRQEWLVRRRADLEAALLS